jgi:hypothetical protein
LCLIVCFTNGLGNRFCACCGEAALVVFMHFGDLAWILVAVEARCVFGSQERVCVCCCFFIAGFGLVLVVGSFGLWYLYVFKTGNAKS